MKKSFAGLLVLLFAAISLYAQKLELSGGLGFQHHTRLRSKETVALIQTQPLRQSAPMLSLTGLYNVQKWQVGLSLKYTSINYGIQDFLPLPNVDYFRGPQIKQGQFSVLPVTMIVNRKFGFKKLDLYSGVSAGYVLSWSGKDNYGDMATSPLGANHGYFGYTAGVQVGGNYYFGRHMGINAEVGYTYTNFRQNTFDPTYTFSIPAVLGFKYRFKPDTNRHR